MQKIKQTAHNLWQAIRHHPWRFLLISAGSLAIILGGISMIPRTIQFSYAGESCVSKVVLLPDTLQSAGDGYKLEVVDTVAIGNVELFGRRVCVTPTAVPQPGTENGRLSWGGISFPAHYFRVETPEAPLMRLDAVKRPIAAAKPLSLSLSTKDAIFDYVASSGDRSVNCRSADDTVHCEIAELRLVQGEPQQLVLQRQFDGEKVATLFNDTINVLPAVNVVDSSVKDGQTIYTKNAPFILTTDKSLLSGTARLERRSGEEKTGYKVTVKVVDGTKVEIMPVDEDLPRAAEYVLTLDEVEAEDGSGLAGPYETSFTLSSGPKVSSVNVGATGIDPYARIVLQLDQVRKEDQNIADLVKVHGVPATATATKDAIVVTLTGAGRCTDFSIAISKEITSEYDVKATDDWSFKGRTRCHTVETIGYSVGGRAINAYIYGNGATTYMYTAGTHGNELSSVYTVQSWMNDLEANPGKIPANARVVVIPRVNPDGVTRGGRDNNNGVNLNRNFPTHNWTSTITTGSGEQAGGGGASAGSEPETKALMNATYRYAPRFVITYHSSGYLVNSNDVGVSIAAGQRYAQLARYQFIPDSQTTATFGFTMTGTYEDWLIARGTPAILIELDTNTGNHYSRNSAAMWAMLGY